MLNLHSGSCVCVPVEDRRGSSRLSIDDIGLLSREKPDLPVFPLPVMLYSLYSHC